MLCADPGVESVQVIEWFVLRWQVVPIYRDQEVRTHGMDYIQEAAAPRGPPTHYSALIMSWLVQADENMGNSDHPTGVQQPDELLSLGLRAFHLAVLAPRVLLPPSPWCYTLQGLPP